MGGGRVCRWSYDGCYFAKKGEDVLSIYDVPVSCDNTSILSSLISLSSLFVFFSELRFIGQEISDR